MSVPPELPVSAAPEPGAPQSPAHDAPVAPVAPAYDAAAPQAHDAVAAQTRPRTRVERFRAWRFAPLVEVIATIAVALALAESVQAVTVPDTEPCPRSNSQASSQYFVKRVIGLPGDRVSISDGHPVINGKPLWSEPYILPCVESQSCYYPHAMTVPRGEYFMLGDNRGDSDDSRFWGPIPGSWIIGEVFATYWPPDRIGVF